MTTSTVTARRKGDAQHYVEGKIYLFRLFHYICFVLFHFMPLSLPVGFIATSISFTGNAMGYSWDIAGIAHSQVGAHLKVRDNLNSSAKSAAQAN